MHSDSESFVGWPPSKTENGIVYLLFNYIPPISVLQPESSRQTLLQIEKLLNIYPITNPITPEERLLEYYVTPPATSKGTPAFQAPMETIKGVSPPQSAPRPLDKHVLRNVSAATSKGEPIPIPRKTFKNVMDFLLRF